MIVRAANRDDHDSVLELMRLMNPDDPVLSKKSSLEIFNQILQSKSFTITVAELSKSIVGSCYINIIPNLTRAAAPYAVIENVITHPDFRRKGIGKALISNALDMAKISGCYKVMLLTGGDANVQSFYESCGLKSGLKTAYIKRW